MRYRAKPSQQPMDDTTHRSHRTLMSCRSIDMESTSSDGLPRNLEKRNYHRTEQNQASIHILHNHVTPSILSPQKKNRIHIHTISIQAPLSPASLNCSNVETCPPASEASSRSSSRMRLSTSNFPSLPQYSAFPSPLTHASVMRT